MELNPKLNQKISEYVLECIFVEEETTPTLQEFLKGSNKDLQNWQVCEEYENYDYYSLIQLFHEKLYEFKTIVNITQNNKELL